MGESLAALRPLHAPPPIPWWPPAPGWWLLAGLVLVAVAALVWWRRQGAVRRGALRELRELEAGDASPSLVAAAINRLLKRYALVCYPHREVAALSGQAWLDFLASHGGGATWAGAEGRRLLELAYAEAGTASTGTDRLVALARQWIKASRPRPAA